MGRSLIGSTFLEKIKREELGRQENCFFKKSVSVKENREMELCYRRGSGNQEALLIF